MDDELEPTKQKVDFKALPCVVQDEFNLPSLSPMLKKTQISWKTSPMIQNLSNCLSSTTQGALNSQIVNGQTSSPAEPLTSIGQDNIPSLVTRGIQRSLGTSNLLLGQTNPQKLLMTMENWLPLGTSHPRLPSLSSLIGLLNSLTTASTLKASLV